MPRPPHSASVAPPVALLLICLGGAAAFAGEPDIRSDPAPKQGGEDDRGGLPLGPSTVEASAPAPVPETQPASPEAREPEVAIPDGPPFLGLIYGEDVNLRAGPGTGYDAVARLPNGTRLAVLGESHGWYEVRPPVADLKLFASRDFLDVKAGEPVAFVLGDRVNIRGRAAADAGIVGQLRRGDLVRVLGEEGDWVAIVPPEDVTLYVHAELVRPIGPLDRAGPAPIEKLLKARDLYLAEVAKKNVADMAFDECIRLFEEAEAEAKDAETRAAAEDGLARSRRAEALKADLKSAAGPLPPPPSPPPPP